MTFVTAVLFSALRALIVTALVLIVSRVWSRWLDDSPARWRSARWVLVLVPGLIPELLLGYAYTPWVVGRPLRAEVVCATLLGLRLLPVGLVAWQLTPPSPLTASAWHLRSLSPPRTWNGWLKFYWIDAVPRIIPLAAIVWLLAFQEFELAALLRAVSWTDTLFVDQVGGRAFGDLVRSALGPAVVQAVTIFAAMRSLTKSSCCERVPVIFPAPRQGTGRASGTQSTVILSLGAVWTLLAIVPLSSMLRGLPAGVVQLAGQPLRWQGLLRELTGGLAVSVTAGCAVWIIAGWVQWPPVNDRGLRRGLLVAACLPGLSGSLVLSLGTLTVFQRSWLSGLYDTPVMWVLASILFLLPRAVLLRLWLAKGDNTSIALARLLSVSNSARQRQSGRTLLWRMETEPRFLAVCCLVYWSYLELPLAVMLAPTGLPSGLVRLYNFLHFGRTAALSAEMMILLGGPLLLAAVAWGLARRGRV